MGSRAEKWVVNGGTHLILIRGWSGREGHFKDWEWKGR